MPTAVPRRWRSSSPTGPTRSSALLTIDARRARPRCVTYRTSPDASGLQWLEPSMTEGKKQPLHVQPVAADPRAAWCRCRTRRRSASRTPRTSPRPDAMVLMSADNDPERGARRRLHLPHAAEDPPWPARDAAGDLVFADQRPQRGGPNRRWSTRPSTSSEDTEKMIQTAEKLYGPYRWGSLRPAGAAAPFPIGGMENPRLTFATPTVIVGDKSLVSLVAHELAHSWSGNLVTFAVDRNAWLNEGITTYVQGPHHRGAVRPGHGRHGAGDRPRRAEEGIRDARPEAAGAVAEAGELQDPDDAASDTVYTKGAWFMQWLEQKFGREVFDPWLRATSTTSRSRASPPSSSATTCRRTWWTSTRAR